MKKNKKHIPIWIFCGISLLISIVALIIAIAGLKGYSICDFEIAYSITMDFAGIIFAVTGVVLTIYFITFAIDIFKLDRKMAKAHELEESVRDEMNMARKEFTDLLEGTTSEKKYARLFGARISIKSRFSTEDEMAGAILALSESDEWEDYNLLRDKIVNNPEIKEDMKNRAKAAMKEIEVRIERKNEKAQSPKTGKKKKR